MKYKLIKKLNGIPEVLEFEYSSIDHPKCSMLTMTDCVIGKKLYDYIELVGIDDEDNFEKIEEDILVPDGIEIENCSYGLGIKKGTQILYYYEGDYIIGKSGHSSLLKCKLVKTDMYELKIGDIFCSDIKYIDNINEYHLYLGIDLDSGNRKGVHFDYGISEEFFFGGGPAYKVVQV